MEILAEPRTFQNGYLLQALLGKGHLGVVYLAATWNPEPNHIAIKLIDQNRAAGIDHWAEIEQEAYAAMAARGPYIARLRSFESSGREPYLVTDYAPSLSLAEALSGGRPLPATTVRLLGAALTSALEKLHSIGIVHRDLKPANVLLARNGPLIIDFGIARLAAGTLRNVSREIAGTPGYMAPEQYRTYEVGPESDIFSLGVLLAHALTGTAPFGKADVREHQRRASAGPPNVAALPEPWRQLVTDCLQPDPGNRPTAVEVGRRLMVTDLDSSFGRRWLPPNLQHVIDLRTRQTAQLAAAARDRPAPTIRAVDDSRPASGMVDSSAGGHSAPRSPLPERRWPAMAALFAAVAAAGGLAWWSLQHTGSEKTRASGLPLASSTASSAPEPLTNHDDAKCVKSGSNSRRPYLCPVSWGRPNDQNVQQIPVFAQPSAGPTVGAQSQSKVS